MSPEVWLIHQTKTVFQGKTFQFSIEEIIYAFTLARAKAAASRFVKYDIDNKTPLGVVTFSSSATTVVFSSSHQNHVKSSFQVLPVDLVTDANRDSIVTTISEIPSGGGTCIDLGLSEGLSALKAYDQQANGGVMILLTDGEYSCSGDKTWPTFESDLAAIKGQGVRVITIALSNAADEKIETLAVETGGASFFVPDNSGPSDLNNAFSGALAYQPEGPMAEKSVAIVEKTFLGQSNIEVEFTIDAFASRELLLQLDFDANSIVKISVDNIVLENLFDTTAEVYRNTVLDLGLGLHNLTVSSNNNMAAVSVKVKHCVMILVRIWACTLHTCVSQAFLRDLKGPSLCIKRQFSKLKP